jgi:hypothetical protein
MNNTIGAQTPEGQMYDAIEWAKTKEEPQESARKEPTAKKRRRRAMLGANEDIELLNKYKRALEHISALWPEPPNCADINEVNGINDGRSRAIIASAAITIAREALK